MRNWTDEELQDFLDKRFSMGDESLRKISKQSAKTRKELETYSKLYGLLKKEPQVNLSPNFSQTVVSRIQKQNAPSSAFNGWQILFGIAGFSFSLTLTYLFGGFKFLANYAGQSNTLKLIESLSTFLNGFDINFSLIAAGICILILISAVDSILLRTKVPFSILG